MNIAQTSPLYEYWNSEQDENDEKKRLLKLNPKEPASNLFSSEPYKWENLYQSVLRNVIDGDESSLKGLMVLLSTICLLYTSPSPRDRTRSRMPSSA